MIGQYTKHIEVEGIPYACCDLCQKWKSAPLISLLLKHEPLKPAYELAAASSIDATFRGELNKEGWTSELFHGKKLTLCPDCTKA